MYFSEKRIKLSNEGCINKTKNESSSANSTDQGLESGFNSQFDFTNSAADFSLPPVKRKSQFSRHVSFSKHRKSLDLADSQQTSSGYSSMLSNSSTASSPRQKSQNRTPRKRKLEESDENAFYNSYQFVSPLKIRKKDESINNFKRAKLILKEKCSSENVILSSTPIRENKNKLWGKFRSLHPERFDIGKSLEDTEPIEKPTILPKTDLSFVCDSSFDFTNSFDITDNVEHQNKSTIPNHFQQLCTGRINIDSFSRKRSFVGSFVQPIETITQPQGQLSSTSTVTSSKLRYYGGRLKLDIMGKLHLQQNLALPMILQHMSPHDLLSLSHVSQSYSDMIRSNINFETKRQNYLIKQRQNQENKLPGSYAPSSPKPNALKNHKRVFGDLNVNHSMQLRPKPVSPPVSPSRRRFHENQKVALNHTGTIKKCPRCSKPAKINSAKIRSSPRKKKKVTSILKISSGTTGRVQKRNKSFLSKSSIDIGSFNDELFVTFPMLEDSSGNTSGSSSCASPGTPSSDESAGSGNEINEAESYEYGICSGISCNFKFCAKCNCKSHPRQKCKDFSPPSPGRIQLNVSSVAGSKLSKKSLKRLIY